MEAWKNKLLAWMMVLIERPIAWLDKKFPVESIKKNRQVIKEARHETEKDNKKII